MFAIKRMICLMLFAVICLTVNTSFCFASGVALKERVALDTVVADYNKFFADKINMAIQNKIKVGTRKEGGVVYAYSINGRNDQILRFYTNAQGEVLGFEALLHVHSPVMKECVEKKFKRRITSMLWGLLMTSESMLGAEDDRVHNIINGMDQLDYYLDNSGKIWFLNNDRKYWIEKTFDRSTSSLKIVVYANRI